MSSSPPNSNITSPRRFSSLFTSSILTGSNSNSSTNKNDESTNKSTHRSRTTRMHRSSSHGGPHRPTGTHGTRGTSGGSSGSGGSGDATSGGGGLPVSGRPSRPAYIQIPQPSNQWAEYGGSGIFNGHPYGGGGNVSGANGPLTAPIRARDAETMSLPAQTPTTPLGFASSAVAQIRKKSSYFFGGRTGRKYSWLISSNQSASAGVTNSNTGIPSAGPVMSSAASASGISMWSSGGVGGHSSSNSATTVGANAVSSDARSVKSVSAIGRTTTTSKSTTTSGQPEVSPPTSTTSTTLSAVTSGGNGHHTSTSAASAGSLRKKMSMPALRQHSRSGSMSSSISYHPHHQHQLSASGVIYPASLGAGSGSTKLGSHLALSPHHLHLPHSRHARTDSQDSSGNGGGSVGMGSVGGSTVGDTSSAVSLRNPAEFMIHALFVEFAAAAEGKLNWVMKQSLDQEPDIAGHMRHGADPEFDKLLVAIGAIARQRPNDVVDALMLWRKSKLKMPDSAWNRHENIPQTRTKEVLAALQERFSYVCAMVLFRALIEVVRQLHERTLLEDLGKKLEDLVFKQIQIDPDKIAQSVNRRAMMALFAELLGWMSNVRFMSVSDRFIAELEKLPPDADGKENRRTELLLRSMRFLRVKLYPESALQDTSDFLQSLAKFFSNAHSFKVKHAYAQLFVELLLPLAPNATVEVNYPGWTDAMEMLLPRAFKMATKPKYWMSGFPLLTTVLCVSKRELFLEKWTLFLDLCFQKLKDKHVRAPALNAIARLVWVYLNRCKESTNLTTKRIESIIRALFPVGKRTFLPTDVQADALVTIIRIILTQDIDYGTKHHIPFLLGGIDATGSVAWSVDTMLPERGAMVIRAYLLALTDAERGQTKAIFPPGNDLRIVDPSLLECSLEPLPDALLNRKSIHSADERMSKIIGEIWRHFDRTYGQQLLLDDRFLNSRNMYSLSGILNNALRDVTNEQAQTVYSHLTTLTVDYPQEKQPYFDLLRCCVDAVPRCMPADMSVTRVVEMLCRYTVHVDSDLAQAAARALIRLGHQRGGYIVVSGMSKFICDIDDRFAELLVGSFAPSTDSDEFGLLQLYVKLLELWSDEMLLTPLPADAAANKDVVDPAASSTTLVAQEAPQIGTKPRFQSFKVADLNPPEVWNLIGETEANGLIFLCSQSPLIRKYAVRILRLAVEVEQQFKVHESLRDHRRHDRHKSTASTQTTASEAESQMHVIDLLDMTVAEFSAYRAEALMTHDSIQMGADDPGPTYGPTLNAGSREKRGLGNDLPDMRLRELAESENPEHLQAWHKNFMELVNTCFSRYPMTIAVCRKTACARLTQMQMLVAVAADMQTNAPATPTAAAFPSTAGGVGTSGLNGIGSGSTSSSKPKQSPITDRFIDQWSAYLRFACATMTPTVNTKSQLVPAHNLQGLSTSGSPYGQFGGSSSMLSGKMISRQRSTSSAAPITVLQSIRSAYDLFRSVMPYLACEHHKIREAVVDAFGHVNHSVFTQLLDEIQTLAQEVLEDPWLMTRSRDAGLTEGSAALNKPPSRHQRQQMGSASAITGKTSTDMTNSNNASASGNSTLSGSNSGGGRSVLAPLPTTSSVSRSFSNAVYSPPSAGLARRNRRLDRLRTDITHVYQMMSRFLRYDEYLRHPNVVPRMVQWLDKTRQFLADPEIQLEWEFQELRRYFAGLAENLCWHLPRLPESSHLMSFNLRLALYRTLEEWCGHGQYRELTRGRELEMMRPVLSQYKNVLEQGRITLSLEMQRKATEVAALRAMAACCRGPLSINGDNDTAESFDLNSIHAWIESVFSSHERRLHSIARAALESLMTFNSDKPEIFDTIIRRCYMLSDPEVNTQGYFLALIDILTRARSYPCEVHVVLGLALFKVGDPDREVRRTAVRLLQVLEERFLIESSVIEFEVALYSNLTTIYKQAQYALSARLAQRHPEITYEVISEMMVRLEVVSSREAQREMIISVLPWLVNVELHMDPDDENELEVNSHIILNNLFYLTIKFSDVFYKELEKAWEQLVIDNRAYNARIVIIYLLHLALEKRNPSIIAYAKRVVVYLGRATAREETINALIDEITPRGLVPEKRTDVRQYDKVPRIRVANIDKELGAYTKRPEFSRAQLATVLLVDLAIEAGPSLLPHLPKILHACAIQFDHNILMIAEQMRLLLGHLICSVFFGRPMDSSDDMPFTLGGLRFFGKRDDSKEMMELACSIVEMLGIDIGLTQPSTGDSSKDRRQLLQRMSMLNYMTPPKRPRNTSITEPLVTRIVRLFSYKVPDIGQRWGETALQWGTQCPLRKAACGSFRVFRMLAPQFTEGMLADILRRLSNTISDQSEEIQEFAVEILITLKSLLEPLKTEHILACPTTFWATVAILYTGSQNEYSIGIEMLGTMLDRLDFDDPVTQEKLSNSFPDGWNAEFDGILPLLAKGLRCQETEPRCLRMMNQLILVEGDALLDPTESRYLFAILANLPWFTRTVEEMSYDDRVTEVAGKFAKVAESKGQETLRRTLDSLARRRFRPKDDFVRQMYLALKEVYFPRYEWHALTFIAELLANPIPWYRRSVLHILRTLLSFIDLRRGDGQDEPSGTEIVIAPLLRLLPTEYADDALEVLEVAMQACTPTPGSNTSPNASMGTNAGNSTGGNVHPNFTTESMTRAHVITAIAQREFETVPSIFRSAANGDDTTSVPFVVDFAACLHVTRQNITAVLQACMETVGMPYEDAPMVYLAYDNQSVFDFAGVAAAAAAGVPSWQGNNSIMYDPLEEHISEMGEDAFAQMMLDQDGLLANGSAVVGEEDEVHLEEDPHSSLENILSQLDDLNAHFGNDVALDDGETMVDNLDTEAGTTLPELDGMREEYDGVAYETDMNTLDQHTSYDAMDEPQLGSPSSDDTSDGQASHSRSHTHSAGVPLESRNSTGSYSNMEHRTKEHFRFPAPPQTTEPPVTSDHDDLDDDDDDDEDDDDPTWDEDEQNNQIAELESIMFPFDDTRSILSTESTMTLATGNIAVASRQDRMHRRHTSRPTDH